jgi:hypothetical protein
VRPSRSPISPNPPASRLSKDGVDRFKFLQSRLQRAARFENPLRGRVSSLGAKLLELLYHLVTGGEESTESAALVQAHLCRLPARGRQDLHWRVDPLTHHTGNRGGLGAVGPENGADAALLAARKRRHDGIGARRRIPQLPRRRARIPLMHTENDAERPSVTAAARVFHQEAGSVRGCAGSSLPVPLNGLAAIGI